MVHADSDWSVVDAWWAEYVQRQESGLSDLRGVLDDLNQVWDGSKCQFDRDPLVVDWTETSPQAGPLRTNQEENWSQWLAHLLRDSDGAYPRALFGPDFAAIPSHVRCERAFHDEDLHDRRVDILAEFPAKGVTIEVKTGDEHYAKTPQTAYLTEKHHPETLDWEHYLLVREDKEDVLESEFGGQLSTSDADRPVIDATGVEERAITVLYWADIARALRLTLLADEEPSHHWVASAYLFTTLIEEQLLQFYPLPSLAQYQATSFGISDIDRLQSVTPDDQISYLHTVLEVITNG